MSCTSPNKVFYVGINPETGKKKIVFTSRDVTHVFRRVNGSVQHVRDISDMPYKSKSEGWQAATGDPDATLALGYDVITNCDLVPCGQCIGCRLDYAREWSARLMLEKKKYDDSECWFVTCTYDDDHLPPKGEAINYVTGEYEESPFNPLSKEDHQLFMKQVRDAFGKCRFFCSGEYGSRTYRPHLHYILFGVKIDDLKDTGKRNFRGEPYYTSEKLSNCWTKIIPGTKQKERKGWVVLGKVTSDSCEYVARYIMKKHKGVDADIYESLGIIPEFCCMSRRPGIGKEYFEENYDEMYKTDKVVIPTLSGAFTTKVPKYFDSLLERIDPDRYAETKGIRKIKSIETEEFRKYLVPFLSDEQRYSTLEDKLNHKVTVKKESEL